MSIEGQGKSAAWICPKCKAKNEGNFCSVCGTARPANYSVQNREIKTKNALSTVEKVKIGILTCICLCIVCLLAVLLYAAKDNSAIEKPDDTTYMMDATVETIEPTAQTERKEEPTVVETTEAETLPEREIPHYSRGQVVCLGTYKNDKTGTVRENIQWDVLDVRDHKILLLSRFGLDAVQYDERCGDRVWADSGIREWLNNSFLYEAFTDAERQSIELTFVDNSASQGYGRWNTDGGENTNDYIFLLSYAEAKKYFNVSDPGKDGPTNARIQPTEYAAEKGAYVSEQYQTSDGKYAAHWWLRSPGYSQSYAACVYSRGNLGERMCTEADTCIRPAMWIDLEKLPY